MTLTINCLVVTDDCEFIDVKSSLSFPLDASVISASKGDIRNHFCSSLLRLSRFDPLEAAFPLSCVPSRLGKPSRLGLYFANESPSNSQVHVIAQLLKEPYAYADRGKQEREAGYVESEGLTGLRQYMAKSGNGRTSHSQRSPQKGRSSRPNSPLYRPFGEFLDRIRDYPQEDDGVDLKALELAVEDFASAMSRHYWFEKDRRILAFGLLDRVFSSNRSLVLPSIHVGTVSQYWKSDGHANGPAHIMETIVQSGTKSGPVMPFQRSG